MTTRIAVALVIALTAVVVAESLVLVRDRDELKVLRTNERERLRFCSSYRSVIVSLESALKNPRNVNDPAFESAFLWVTMDPFLDVCHTREPTRSKIARRDWGCKRAVLGVPQYDYGCLARVAGELQGAIPFE